MEHVSAMQAGKEARVNFLAATKSRTVLAMETALIETNVVAMLVTQERIAAHSPRVHQNKIVTAMVCV